MFRNEDPNTAIKDLYSNLSTAIYKKILQQKNTGRTLPGWHKEESKEYDVETWTFTRATDTEDFPVGSNGQIVVKIFGEQSYDYVKTEDFLARGELILDAAAKIAEENNNPLLTVHIKQLLGQLRQKFIDDIKKEASLDVALMCSRDKQKKKEHFKKKFAIAKKKIEQLLVDVSAQLLSNLPKDMALSPKDIREKIKEAEKQVIAKRGRPHVIKIGKVGNETQISAQFTQGAQTLPSSLRRDNFDTKLSNHVLDGSGHLTLDGKIQFDLMVDSHSTYSPYEESDPLLKQKIAHQAVLEKLTATAKNLLSIADSASTLGKDATHPLRISLSTLMLLTPLANQSFSKIVQNKESEHEQLEVAKIALELVNHSKQPLVLIVNQKPIYVSVDITYMNIPSNKYGVGIPGAMMEDRLNVNVNQRGFYEYSKNMERALEKLKSKSLSAPSDAEVEIHKTTISEATKELGEKYSQLNNLLSKYQPNNNNTVASPLQKEFTQIKNSIQKIENEISYAYQLLNESAYSHFQKSKPEKKIKKFDRLLKKNDLSTADRQYYLLKQRYLRAQKMYYSGDYKNPKYAFQFQVLYLLTNEQSGRFIECFCKSAEDRTGWLRISLLAHLAFRQTHGRDPDLNSKEHRVELANKTDREAYDQIFAFAAHQLSASLENTKYNSEARGLQVKGELTNPHIGMAMGDALAKMAKGIFKTTLAPSALDLPNLSTRAPAAPNKPTPQTPTFFYHPHSIPSVREKIISETLTPIAAPAATNSPPRALSSTANLSTRGDEPQFNQEAETLSLVLQKTTSSLRVEFREQRDPISKKFSSDLVDPELKLDIAYQFALSAKTKFPSFAPFADTEKTLAQFDAIIENLKNQKSYISQETLANTLTTHFTELPEEAVRNLAAGLYQNYLELTEQPRDPSQPNAHPFPSDDLIRIATHHVDSYVDSFSIEDRHIVLNHAWDPHYLEAVVLYCKMKGYGFTNGSSWKLEEPSSKRVEDFKQFYTTSYATIVRKDEKTESLHLNAN